MRVGVGRRLAAGKICTALLLAVVPVAMVSPGSDVAFSQSTTGTAAQARLFTAIDLTASGVTDSQAWDISGGQQVGGFSPDTPNHPHALLWRGSAANRVDLDPTEFSGSQAFGVCGGQQVGGIWVGGSPEYQGTTHAALWRGSAASVEDLNPHGFGFSVALGTSHAEQVGRGAGTATGGDDHALLWRGSAASVVDLHPRGFTSSGAYRTNGQEQVGSGVPQVASLVPLPPLTGPNAARFPATHALLWRGSAASVVDLHAFLPPGFVLSFASGIDAAGDIVGSALGPEPYIYHAFLWRRNVPKPSNSWEQDTMRCR